MFAKRSKLQTVFKLLADSLERRVAASRNRYPALGGTYATYSGTYSTHFAFRPSGTWRRA